MKIFSKFLKPLKTETPSIQMGRYSDLYHQEEKFYLWEKSYKYFESKKYLDSLKCLLEFLRRDEVENIHFKISKGQLLFKLFQGSQIIEGMADHIHFKASANIITLSTRELNLLHEALESNYELEYSRYALDKDNNLLLVFDSFIEDASPQKVYNGLKELASLADKSDNILLSKYTHLSAIHDHHIRQISHEEKTIKFQFLKSEIENLFQEVEKSKTQYHLYPGALTYQVLSLTYKIDFLLKPEGIILEKIREIHAFHTRHYNMNILEKNEHIMQIIHSLNTIKFEEFEKEIYDVISTFGEARTVKSEKIKNLIDLHSEEAEWYYHNGFENCALAIWDYVVGYILYSFALPKPIKELFIMYYQIRHHQFFSDLGFKSDFYKKNGLINLKKIKNELKAISGKHKDNYFDTSLNLKGLKSDDAYIFAESFLSMVRHSPFPEKKL